MACQVVHAVEKKITVVREESRVKPRGFPGGTVVKDPPVYAGDMGSIPGQGTKIPHATNRVHELKILQRKIPHDSNKESVCHN